MKTSNNLEDLFRQGEPRLNQAPGKHVWNRLESRLDQSQSNPRLRMESSKLLSMAASLLVILASTLLFLTVVKMNDKPQSTDLVVMLKLNTDPSVEHLDFEKLEAAYKANPEYRDNYSENQITVRKRQDS